VQAFIFSRLFWRRASRDAAIVVAAAICLARATGLAWPDAWDFHAYYAADLGRLYADSAPGAPGAFLYSPLFAQIMEPLRWLPFNVALALWTALELGSLIYLAGPWSLPLFIPLAPEWMNGNIHLVMAAAVYAGLRGASPWAWTVPVFTKLSPAIGLVWFAFRRQWSQLAGAIVLVGILGAASLVLAPQLWVGWAQMLLANAAIPGRLPGEIAVPLLVRLPLALGLLVIGARSDRRWVVPLGCALVMPSFWISAVFAFGIAAFRLAAIPKVRLIRVPQLAASRRGVEHQAALSAIPVVVATNS
jgi:hypothetical protein